MNKLIFANLLHRPLRSVISVLAVAIEVIMILSIVGIFMGMLNDQKDRTNGIGADLILRPSNASIMNGISGAPIPVKDIEVIRRVASCGRGRAGNYAVPHRHRRLRRGLRHRLRLLQRTPSLRLCFRRAISMDRMT